MHGITKTIQTINGDLLKSNANFILHQVNCKGVMGAGLALQVKKQYPFVFSKYSRKCKAATNSRDLLGTVQYIPVKESQTIVNLFAQDGYGRTGQHTSYRALISCLEDVNRHTKPSDTIAIPYKIGCGLGGGDWDKVQDIISSILVGRDVTFYDTGVARDILPDEHDKKQRTTFKGAYGTRDEFS